jgi:hypothetical protein
MHDHDSWWWSYCLPLWKIQHLQYSSLSKWTVSVPLFVSVFIYDLDLLYPYHHGSRPSYCLSSPPQVDSWMSPPLPPSNAMFLFYFYSSSLLPRLGWCLVKLSHKRKLPVGFREERARMSQRTPMVVSVVPKDRWCYQGYIHSENNPLSWFIKQ